MFNFFKREAIDSIDVNSIDNSQKKINLIDIREPHEYKGGHLPKAKNIPMGNIISNTEKYLDKSKEYHLICRTGARSSRTCRKLSKRGFNVINVAGGTIRYKGKLK